jgi:preprotein translocase subunit SecG
MGPAKNKAIRPKLDRTRFKPVPVLLFFLALISCFLEGFRLMQNVLLVLQLIIAIALIGVILVQRTAQDGGGLTGGGSTMGGLFTARGSANLLTRATALLAVFFIANSLALGALASSQHQSRSILDTIAPVAPVSAPATSGTAANKATDKPAQPVEPTVPAVPLAK